MSYVNLIDTQLNNAYVQLKDLATTVVFNNRDVTGFDFSSAEPTVEVDPGKRVKAVILKESKKDNVRTVQLLLKTADLPEISQFDTVDIKGETWAVGPVTHQRRYVTLLNVVLGG